MKKILILALILCCNKFILVAQENVRSTLTLVTTDLMNSEIRYNFNWLSFSSSPVHYQGANLYRATLFNTLTYFDDNNIKDPTSPVIFVKKYIAGSNNSNSLHRSLLGFEDPRDPFCCEYYATFEQGSDGSNIQVTPWEERNCWCHPGGGGGGPVGGNTGNPSDNPMGGGGGSSNGAGASTPPPTQPTDPTGSMSPPKRKDTLAPIIKPCNDTANKIGDSLTRFMFNHIDTMQQMKYLKDSCTTKTKESGLRIRPAVPFSKPYTKFIQDLFIKDGNTQSANIPQNRWTYVTIHTHTVFNDSGTPIDECPSTKDIFQTLKLISTTANPVKFFAGINMYNGTGQQYALASSDTNAVALYYNPVTENSYLDTNQTVTDSSTTPPTVKPNPYFNNYRGDINDPNTPLGMYSDAVDKFTAEGYPKEKINTYAKVYMLNQLNTPLKIYSRDISTGAFKELNFTTEDITVKGKTTTHFRITICN